MNPPTQDPAGPGGPNAEIIRICEHEKEAIGRVLHDDLGQKLAAANFVSHALAGALASSGSANAEQASSLCGLIREAQAFTRALARGLHPPKLAADELPNALAGLAGETSSIFHTDCRFETPGEWRHPFDDETADHLHHIACEAVRNALHHGRASKIRIRLDFRGDHAFLTISDNGTGAHEGKCTTKGLGTQIMKNRAALCGGTLTISKAPQEGTVVTCTIPVHPHHSHRWGLSDFII